MKKFLGSCVIAISFLILSPVLVHAQVDTIPSGSVPLGGTCITDLDCSGANFCRSNGSGMTCQNLGSAAPTNSSQITGGLPTTVTPAATSPTSATGATTGLINPLNATSLSQLLQEILGYVVELGGIFLTIMLVYVGFLFVAARGNDEKIRSARTALMWTVVGGLLLLGASALASVISATVQGL